MNKQHIDAKILKAQILIQNNLGGDLSLQKVADHVGSSPNHFHQMFKQALGETVKAYTDRLRVEKSLYDIRISDLSLLQIAGRYGFKNPETYSRTFKRHFGSNPSAWVEKHRPSLKLNNNPSHVTTAHGLRQSKAAHFSVTKLKTIHLAFIRHIGDYHSVPLISSPGQTPWRELADFVRQHQLVDALADQNRPEVSDDLAPLMYFGIPQDSPNTTATEKLRYDMAVRVRDAFHSHSHIGHQTIEAGYYGVLTHAGPYETLSEAYLQLFTQASQLPQFSLAPKPVFELLINIEAKNQSDHTWTELYIPLLKKLP